MKKVISLLLSAVMLLSGFTTGTAYAATTKEKEPNNSMTAANSVALNDTIYGKSDTYTDIDYYKFTVNNNGKVDISFTFEPTDSYGYWYVVILDKDGLVISEKDVCTNNGSYSFEPIGVKPDTYYIKVSDIYYASLTTITYGVNVNYQQRNDWEKESNDVKDQASALTLNSRMNGVTSNYGVTTLDEDVDYYRFTLPKAGKVDVEFSIEGKNTSAEWVVYLFYNANNYYSMTVCENDESKSFAPLGLPAGSYYIKVVSNRGLSTNTYGLTVKYQQRNDWEKESNDVWDEANALSLNGRMNGVITDDEDEDYYKFTLPSSGKVNIAFSINGKKTEKEWRVKLVDSNKNDISETEIKENSGSKSMTSPTLRKGTYYLVVSPYYSWRYSTSIYGLTVSPDPTPSTPSGFKVVKRYSKKAKLSWKKVSGANGYQLQYSPKSNMKGKKTENIANPNATAKTVKKLKKNKKYYVRIRSYKFVNGKKLYSAWSKTKVIKAK